MLWRPAESLLLVLGMALAVGATAAGLALAGRIAEQSRERLASPRYREIVVATRQQAGDMETPARLRTASDVVLTADDLEARHVAPAVRYAYLANPTGFPLGELPIPEQLAEMAGAEDGEAAAPVQVIVIPAGGQVGAPAADGARGSAVEAAADAGQTPASAAAPADGAVQPLAGGRRESRAGPRGGAALPGVRHPTPGDTTPACASPSPIPAVSTRRGRSSPATSRPRTAAARW